MGDRQQSPRRSVRERKKFFEHLSAPPEIHQRRPFVPPSSRIRPVSVAVLDRSRPPPKPKRTFAHQTLGELNKDQSTSSSMSSSISSSPPRQLRNTVIRFKSEDGRHGLPPPRNPNVYITDEEGHIYDIPVNNRFRRCVSSENMRKVPSDHYHPSLYYAATDLSKYPNQYKDKKPIGQKSDTLRRKFAFKNKEKRRNKKYVPFVEPNTLVKGADDPAVCLSRQTSRAQEVRRRTLALDNALLAAMTADKERKELFSTVLIVRLEKTTDPKWKSGMMPVISYRFPARSVECSEMPELFYPDYSHTTPVARKDYWSGDEEFVCALTDDRGRRKNAYCIKFLENRDSEEPEYPLVVVVISVIKNSVFYLDLARNLVMYIQKSMTSFAAFVDSVYQQKYPDNKGCLVVVEKEKNGLGGRRVEIRNHGTVLGKSGCSAIIEKLTPEWTVCVVAALLGEQRVLIGGNSVAMISKAVQVLEALIRPLAWPHTFLPVIPDHLYDLCHNPTPYLMGIMRNNLGKIRELIIDINNTDDNQQDFVFMDLDTGLINPQPFVFDENKSTIDEWRLENAVLFCIRLGMPRKLCVSLIKYLRTAVADGAGPAADLKVENAMMTWYAYLLGHYRFAGCHIMWTKDTKARFVRMHSDAYMRPYLNYLTETSMFDEWINSRCTKGFVVTDEPLPSSEEALNKRIDDIWLDGFQIISPKPFTRMVLEVSNMFTNALHLSGPKKSRASSKRDSQTAS